MAPAPTREEFEQRWAGLRAHNRWLADFCADAPGRRAGVAQILLNDVDEAVREVRRAKEAGLTGGILLPGTPPGSGLPELHSECYDPLWAVCAELDVPVNHHGGSASPPLGDEPAARAVFMVETTWFSHRALWHLVFGGAFRRHPGLSLVLTEQGSGWIPGVLDMLDYYHGRLVAAASRAATAESKFGAGLAAAMGDAPSEDLARATASWAPASCARTRSRSATASASTRSCGAATTRTTRAPTRTPARPSGSPTPASRPTRPRPCSAPTPPASTASTSPASTPIAARVGPTVAESPSPWKRSPPDATSPAFARGGAVRVW